jgi:hypothetical protein
MNARATKRRPINGAGPHSKAGFIRRCFVGRPFRAAGFVDEIAPILAYPNNSLIFIIYGGTRVLSDWLVVRIITNPGETVVHRGSGLSCAGRDLSYDTSASALIVLSARGQERDTDD